MVAFPAAAAAQNDAGTGGDAPDNSGEGPRLPLGTYNGTLPYDEGDLEDWYRVSVPNGSLRLSFLAVQGGLWGGIYREEDGSFVTNAYSAGNEVTLDSGGPGTFRIGFGDQQGAGFAAYVFRAASSLDVEPPQRDGPCGGDAPADARPTQACPIRWPGTFTARLDPAAGDHEDAYAIDLHAPSMRLRVAGEGVEAVFRGVHLAVPFDVEVEGGRGILVVRATGPEAASYAFAIELPPLPDAAVLGVTARPETRHVLAGEMEGDAHVIRVLVENQGEAPGQVAGSVMVRTSVATYHLTLPARTLQPGEQATLEARWSTQGHVGRYAVQAHVTAPYDQTPWNNFGQASEWVLVRAPVGV